MAERVLQKDWDAKRAAQKQAAVATVAEETSEALAKRDAYLSEAGFPVVESQSASSSASESVSASTSESISQSESTPVVPSESTSTSTSESASSSGSESQSEAISS